MGWLEAWKGRTSNKHASYFSMKALLLLLLLFAAAAAAASLYARKTRAAQFPESIPH